MKIATRRLWILSIFVVVILIESISYATYRTALSMVDDKRELIEKEQNFLTEEEQHVLILINEYRKKNGLEELKSYSKLQEMSKMKAQDIVENEYFSHISPNIGSPFEMLEENEIDYLIAGENLAGNITPGEAVDAWICSESHRQNILEARFEYTGICVIESPIYGKVFVQLFIGYKNA